MSVYAGLNPLGKTLFAATGPGQAGGFDSKGRAHVTAASRGSLAKEVNREATHSETAVASPALYGYLDHLDHATLDAQD